jgi:hypothetical protein
MFRRIAWAAQLTLVAVALTPLHAAAFDGRLSVSSTSFQPPGMTGTVAVSGLSAGSDYVLVAAFEALPEPVCASSEKPCSMRVLQGDYEAGFAGCTGGTISGGEELVGPAGRADDPRTFPLTSTPFAIIPDQGSQTVQCTYSLRRISGGMPDGRVDAVRPMAWLLNGSAPVARLTGPQVNMASTAPPATIPEAPLAILLLLAAMGSMLLVLFLARRRLIGGAR